MKRLHKHNVLYRVGDSGEVWGVGCIVLIRVKNNEFHWLHMENTSGDAFKMKIREYKYGLPDFIKGEACSTHGTYEKICSQF
jgi:hypothetical protein